MVMSFGHDRPAVHVQLWLLAIAGCLAGGSADLSPLLSAPTAHYFNSSGPSLPSNTSGRSWREPRAGRVRRFIYFPEGSTITVSVDFVIPLGDSGASLTFSPSITFTPTTIARATYGEHGPGARSFAADQGRLFDTIQDGFKQVGLDGSACLQRLVCEVSGAPRHQDGLLGEVVNTVLLQDYADVNENMVGTDLTVFKNSSSSYDKPKNFRSDDVKAARLHGSSHGNCSERFSTCPVSMFNIF
ncbi:uncharacterized protein LOC122368833 [Amphibalanus amphitrite]|uniref:uncharacterized protein LOC122368833 n=1 Tax=Amphibalanus amphitrite TaxID=1232801 RepID=UPI001C90EB2F|nr:uncharacterized protein LOC122368833 [Amphibalanus amphitrite]